MKIRPYELRDQRAWDAYAARCPDTTLYHTSRWKKVLERTFRNRHYYWLAEDGSGAIRGILPLVHQRSLLFGNFLVSLPHSSYGGLCADDEETALVLVQAAVGTARSLGAEHIQLRQRSRLAGDLPFRDTKVSVHVNLLSDPNVLWSGFSSKLRSQIKRPTKDGFTARVGGKEELDAFYEVFATHMRDLGTPVFPRALFQHVLEEFPEESRLCIVARDGRPAAAAFLLGYGDALEIPWASSLKAHKQSAPNMLLYWTAIRHGAERGYRRIDMGRSTRDGGTLGFKLQWGAVPTDQYWYYWLARPGPLPDVGTGNLGLQTAIRFWKRLPLPVANILGPLVVRYVP